MTTNQTIDGVQRELLERLLHDLPNERTKGELRALLDAPVKKRPTWMDEPFAVAARGEERGSSHGFEQSPNTCRHDERSGVWWREGSITRTGRECCACGNVEEDPAETAAQHQGEPVAFTAVGVLRDDGDGGLLPEWILEGGTAELWAGAVLLIAAGDQELCAEDGHCELYREHPAPAHPKSET